MTYDKVHDAVVSMIADGFITAYIEKREFWQTVREALEKQIPKKPKYKSENSLPSCSQCGGIIDLLQGDANYCPNCGQKLDWTDT